MSQEDATALLNEFVWSIENLPNEVAYLLEEIAYKDERAQDLRHKNSKRDASIQSHHKANGLLAVNAKEGQLVDKIRTDQKKVLKLADEKVALAEKGVRLLEKWVSRLDGEFDRLKDMGYNVGDAEAAAQQAANTMNMSMPGLSGPMQMDTGSNKKRKLQASGSGTNANGSFATGSQATNLAGMNMNNSQYHHLQSSNPYSPSSQAGPSGSSNNAGMYGNISINTSGMTPQQVASMANFNVSAMSPSQQQQFNQVFQQQYTTAINQLQSQQMNGSGTPASPTSAGGVGNSARPLRPSRLSSSFSFSGAGPGVQILPSSAAAHMAGSQGPSGASSLSSSLNQSTSSMPGQKRGRPVTTGSGQAGASGSGQTGGNKKKKKRITISDEESLLEEGASEDAEGDLDDESMLIDYDAGENPKTSSRRPGGGNRTSSRGGTPMSGVPTPASAAFNLANNASAGGPRGNKAGAGGRPRLPTSAAGNKKADKEEEEEEADAEGEEDWANEEANAEDPTLYCVCQRVSYGNMIACDNPGCQLEWFHWSCVNVTKQPLNDEKWFCPDCTALRNNANNASGGSGANRQISTPTSGSSSYQQLQAQQQQMMFAAQQARDGGRPSRRG